MKFNMKAIIICILMLSQTILTTMEATRRVRVQKRTRSHSVSEKSKHTGTHKNSSKSSRAALMRFYKSMGVSGHLTTDIQKDVDQWFLIRNVGHDLCLTAKCGGVALSHTGCNPFDFKQHFKVIPDGTNYFLFSKNNLAVDNRNQKNEEDNSIQMAELNKGIGQKWKIEYTLDGNFYLKNLSASERCLAPRPGKSVYATRTCKNDETFKFTFEPLTTYWVIKSEHNGLCFSGKDKNRDKLSQEGCNFDEQNQQFRVMSNGDGTYQIMSKNGKMIDNENLNPSSNNVAIMFQQNGTGAQRWRIHTSGKALIIRNALVNRCIDTEKNSDDSGRQYFLSECNHTETQKFTFEPVLDWNLVRVKKTGQCLKYSNKTQQLTTTVCNLSDGAQQLRVEAINFDSGANIVQLLGRNTLAVDNYLNQNSVGNIIQMWEVNGTEAQKFILKPKGNYLSFINTSSKKCVEVINGKVSLQNCNDNNDAQLFSFKAIPYDQWVYIKTATDEKCLKMGNNDRDQLSEVPCNGEDNSTYFRVQKYGTSHLIYGYNGKLVDNLNQGKFDGNNVVAFSQTRTAAQQWRFTNYGGNSIFYKIESVSGAGRCLQSGAGNGKMTIYSCRNQNNQLYSFEPVFLVDPAGSTSQQNLPDDLPPTSTARYSDKCDRGFGFSGKKISDFWTIQNSKLPDAFKNIWNKDLVPFLFRKNEWNDAVLGDYTGGDIKEKLKVFRCTVPWKKDEKLGVVGLFIQNMPCAGFKPVQVCVNFDNCGSFGISLNDAALKCMVGGFGLSGIFRKASSSLKEVTFAFSRDAKIEKKFDIGVISTSGFKVQEISVAGHFFAQLGIPLAKKYLDSIRIFGKSGDDIFSIVGTGSVTINFGTLHKSIITLIDQIKDGTMDSGPVLDSILSSGAELALNISATVTFKLMELSNKFLPNISFKIGEANLLLSLGGGSSKQPRGIYLLIKTDILKTLATALSNVFSFFKDVLNALNFAIPSSTIFAASVAVTLNDEAVGFEFDCAIGMVRCFFFYGPKKGGCQFASTFFTAIWEGIKFVFKKAVQFLSEAGQVIGEFIVNGAKAVFNAAKTVVKAVARAVVNTAKAVVRVVNKVVNAVKKFFSGWRRRMRRLRLKLRMLKRMKKMRLI